MFPRNMLKKIFRKKWGLFVKLFASLLLVMLTPTIFISILNFETSQNHLERELNRSNLNTLRQTQAAMDNILQYTQNISNQLIRHEGTQSFLNQTKDIRKFYDAQDVGNVLRFMEILQESASFIDNIYLYSVQNDMLLSTKYRANRQLHTEEKQQFFNLLPEEEDELWVEPYGKAIFDAEHESIQYLKLIHSFDNNSKGFTLIHLKTEEFYQLVRNIFIDTTGFIYIVDEEGHVIAGPPSETANIRSQIAEQPWFQEKQGTQTLKIENSEKLLVSFTTSALNHWRYTAVFPADELKQKSNRILGNIVLIFLFFCVVAFILALSMARGLYNPILAIRNMLKGEKVNDKKWHKLLVRTDELGQINEEIMKLSHRNHENVQELRKYFLFRLASGEIVDESLVVEQAALYGLPLHYGYLAVLVHFDRLHARERNWDEQQLDTFRQHALNVFKDMFKPLSEVESFFVRPDRILCVMHALPGSDRNFILDQIKMKADKFRSAAGDPYEVPITVAVGDFSDNLYLLRQSFRQAEQALQHKFVLGTNIVLLHESLKQAAGNEMLFRYPLTEYFRNSLTSMDFERAVVVLQECRDDLKKNRELTSKYVYYYRHIIHMLIEFLHGNRLFYEELEQLDKKFVNFEEAFTDIDEATVWIEDFVRSLADKFASHAVWSHKVTEAMSIIEKEYMQDPALTEIAERIGIASGQLSRMLKDEVGRTFKEILTDIKLDKAKEMMLQSKLSMEQIAMQVGYNHYRQFARMFKKRENISPQEYRLRMKGD